ncbi:MAG: MerR family transcriptional regulator [Aeromicrobium erythreum]
MGDHVQDICDEFGHDTGLAWSIGECARAIQVPTATLRSWDQRYGLGPSVRTAGGHRRYTCEDVDRVRYMRMLLERGVAAMEASRHALSLDTAELHDANHQFDSA